MTVFILRVLLFFALNEIAAYCLHRWIFHGQFWAVHRSHHQAAHGWFELNDVFSLGFAGLAIWLIVSGWTDGIESWRLAAGIGITAYGFLYFVIHDMFTHGRFVTLKFKNKTLRTIKRAHQNHHHATDKRGQEPYGLFLFPYQKYRPRFLDERQKR